MTKLSANDRAERKQPLSAEPPNDIWLTGDDREGEGSLEQIFREETPGVKVRRKGSLNDFAAALEALGREEQPDAIVLDLEAQTEARSQTLRRLAQAAPFAGILAFADGEYQSAAEATQEIPGAKVVSKAAVSPALARQTVRLATEQRRMQAELQRMQAEQRRMQADLREQEERHQALAEAVPQGLYRVASGEGLVYADQRFAEMFGFDSVEAALKMEPGDLYASVSDPVDWEASTFETRKVRCQRADGSTFLGRLSGTLTLNGEGEPQHFTGSVANISERKGSGPKHKRGPRASEKEVEVSSNEANRHLVRKDDERLEEARLRGIAESVPGIGFQYVTDPDKGGYYLFVGERAESILGISSDPEAFEERFLSRVPEEYHDRHKSCAAAANSGQDPEKVEIPFRRPDGERIWLLLTSVLQHRLGSEDGEKFLVSGIMLNVTEAKQREFELERINTRLQLALESTNTGTFDWDIEADEVNWDETSERLFGYEPGEFPGRYKGWADRVHPEDLPEAERAIEQALETGGTYDVVFRVKTSETSSSDEKRWVRARGSVEYDSDGSPTRMIGIHTDVSEQKRRGAKLRRQNNLLEQTQRLTGAWMADLRTSEMSWSEKVYEIHEMDPSAEVSLEKGLEFYTPESKEKIIEATEALTEEGESYDLELQIETAEGNRRWVRSVGSPAKTEGTETEGGEVVKIAGAFQDITGRKEEERRRQEVIRRVTDGIVEVDAEWQLTLVNDQAEKIYGIGQEEMLGKSVWEVFGGLEGTRFEEVYREAMQSREPAEIEEYYPGLGEWFGEQVYPNEDGGLAIYFKVITERKEREESLRRAKRRYQTLIENFPDGGAFLFDEDLRYVLVGGEKIGVLGDPKDIVGATVQEVLPEELAREQERHCRRALEGERGEFEQKFEGRHYRVQTLPVQGEDEAVISGIVFSRDITQQKRRAEELERKNDLFERAQEIANVGAWEYDATTDEGNWTRKAYEILGYPPEKAPIPRNAVDYYHPEDQARVQEALRGALNEGMSSDLEVRLKSGEELRWVRIRGEPLWEGGEVTRVRGTIQDITDRKKREEALREAKQEAEEASRLKSSFLANMSHEIRTPLTSIIGFAEALGVESSKLELPEESPLPKYADLIEKSGKRLLETLEGVLNLSKLEAGQMELSAEPVGLAGQARQVAEELRLEAEEKQIDLEVQAEDIQAVADEGGVQIVLRNLLSNAIKYTGEGGAVWVRTYQKEGQAVLEVEDTGVGMEPGIAGQLFEPFRQASEGLGREYEGTGVGLAVTQEATEQMGGSIEVETEEGEGTCFTVRLPLEGEAETT